MAIIVGSAAWFWNVPIAQLPATWLWPINRLLSAPHFSAFSSLGWVAAGPFAYACVRSSAALLQAVLPLNVDG